MKNLKKILSYAMMLIMVIFLFLGVNFKKILADEEVEFETNNGTISYEIDNNEVIITHYSGEDTNLEIPSEIDGKSVTSIEDYAFEGCSSLTTIIMPNSIVSIGESSFEGCSSLRGITISNSVISIEDSAFSACSSLTSIMIPNSVVNIGGEVFWYCSSLKNINVEKDNKYFSSEDGILFNKDKSELLCYPCGKKEESYTIPNSVMNIGDYSFFTCSSLTSITIPSSVIDIGSSVFANCIKLKSIIIPDSVINIKSDVFSRCTSLTSITIPDSITSIEEKAFEGCYNLKNIKIPNSVINIEESAFLGCDNLIIYGYKDSYAETYANEEFIQFRDINNQTLNIENLKVNDDKSPQKVETTKTSNSNITIIVIILIGISIIILLWILLITRK